MNDNGSGNKFSDLVVDDQLDEREHYVKEYDVLIEDTQDFSKIIEEIKNDDIQQT